jgi:glycosyltransferase involved in cell wall biosynthesis
MSPRRICLVPCLQGVGGMVSFQGRLAAGLAQRGVEVVYNLAARPLDAVLVIGGTRDLPGLRRIRRSGMPLVQRLDGMNWIHRHRRTGLRHFLRAEYGNLNLTLIRRFLASRIVYQSKFSQDWWERVRGPTRLPHQVIYNGVDLRRFIPQGAHARPTDRFRLLMVEGSLGGGYDLGLAWGVGLAERLHALGFPVELVVASKVSPGLQIAWEERAQIALQFAGLVPLDKIPALDRSAHALFAADIHAACPNSVIEALACGLPVVALDTGALRELVQGDAGRVTPYGGDPWKLDPPDLDGLARAAAEVLQNQERFRRAARQRAEAAFNLDDMVDAYLRALEVA